MKFICGKTWNGNSLPLHPLLVGEALADLWARVTPGRREVALAGAVDDEPADREPGRGGQLVAHFLFVSSVCAFPLCFWNCDWLKTLPDDDFAAGAAFEPPWLFLMMKTAIAAIRSATPTQKMIRVVRCEDMEVETAFIASKSVDAIFPRWLVAAKRLESLSKCPRFP